MNEYIVILLLHCGVEEALVVDTPEMLRVVMAVPERRAEMRSLYEQAIAQGARGQILKVEEATKEKCGTKT